MQLRLRETSPPTPLSINGEGGEGGKIVLASPLPISFAFAQDKHGKGPGVRFNSRGEPS